MCSSLFFVEARKRLVNNLIHEGVLKSEKVIRAMLTVPREEFVLPQHRKRAYADYPLPTLEGQTISAPHMVAIMCELLDLDVSMKILEIGCGSGYHAAICAEIVAPTDGDKSKWGEIYSIEILPSLVDFARSNLKRAGYDDRVNILLGDGSIGYSAEAPYDRILVTAAAPEMPKPLIDQLKVHGKIVIPIGGSYYQELILGVKTSSGKIKKHAMGGCVFVPLIGKFGWKTNFNV